MPRNGSGVYSLPQSPFVPGTTIESGAVNSDFSDIASALTSSVSSDGQTTITGQLRSQAGTANAPEYSFVSDATSGAFLNAVGVLGLSAAGVAVLLNSTAQIASGATLVGGGTNYAVADEVVLAGGNNLTPVVIQVLTLSGSAIASFNIISVGIYTTIPSNPVSQASTTGSGSGATFSLNWTTALAFTNAGGGTLWQALGATSYMASALQSASGLDLANKIGAAAISSLIAVPSPSPQGSFKNLAIKVATNTTVAVTADAVVMYNSAATSFLTKAINATVNLGTSGSVNTLDTGTIAINTWYFIYAISNGVTNGTLASASSTSPTLPSGYVYFARIGAVRTVNASATLYGTWQFGRCAQFIVGLAQTSTSVLMAQGTAGSYSGTSPTLVAVPVGAFVPPTASKINIMVQNLFKGVGTAADILVAPSAAYSGVNQGPNGSTGMIFPFFLTTGGAGTSISGDMILESSNIYWCADNVGGVIGCLGWEDNL